MNLSLNTVLILDEKLRFICFSILGEKNKKQGKNVLKDERTSPPFVLAVVSTITLHLPRYKDLYSMSAESLLVY